MKTYDVAVVGATGAVGETMLDILAERKFPVGNVYPLASAKSAGKRVGFGDKTLKVEDLSEFDFSKVQIGLFSPGASVSKIYAPIAAKAGCVVIDNTSQFRYDDEIPLVVPEVNPHAIGKHNGIIANPNCSTIQMMVALKPIYDEVGIERLNIATYQAVSGTGKEAIEELAYQTAQLLNGREAEAKVYPRQIAFNAIPHIDDFQDNGYTKEEMKMVWETRKILEDDSIMISATAVRVPVFFGHSEAVNIETKSKISAAAVQKLLSVAPGVTVIDERQDGGYPTAVSDAAGHDETYVGRIRDDISHPQAINMWIVSDNVRKGAALNSIQIAEVLIKSYF